MGHPKGVKRDFVARERRRRQAVKPFEQACGAGSGRQPGPQTSRACRPPHMSPAARSRPTGRRSAKRAGGNNRPRDRALDLAAHLDADQPTLWAPGFHRPRPAVCCVIRAVGRSFRRRRARLAGDSISGSIPVRSKRRTSSTSSGISSGRCAANSCGCETVGDAPQPGQTRLAAQRHEFHCSPRR